MVKIHFASGLRLLQYKAERLGWSGSLLLQTEAALIGKYGREQIYYRYVLYMTPLQKTQTIPLTATVKVGCKLHFVMSIWELLISEEMDNAIFYVFFQLFFFVLKQVPVSVSYSGECYNAVLL